MTHPETVPGPGLKPGTVDVLRRAFASFELTLLTRKRELARSMIEHIQRVIHEYCGVRLGPLGYSEEV